MKLRPFLASACLVLPAICALPAAARGQEDVATVPADQSVVLERADRARTRGAADAPIRIVEISDFECPFCARFHSESSRAVDSLYVRSGIARYVWISYPSSGHPRAWPAIEAAFCAGAAGRFWEMHDVLFERQDEWVRAADPNALFRTWPSRWRRSGRRWTASSRSEASRRPRRSASVHRRSDARRPVAFPRSPLPRYAHRHRNGARARARPSLPEGCRG